MQKRWSILQFHFQFPLRWRVLVGLAAILLPLSACANSPLGDSVERTFAADPQLQENPSGSGGDGVAALPTDFPTDIPRYPNAEVVAVGPVSDGGTSPVQTRWRSADSAQQIRQFYQSQFQDSGWQLEADGDRTLTARRDNLVVTLEVPVTPTASAPASNPETGVGTEFLLTYAPDSSTNPGTESPSATPDQPPLSDSWAQSPTSPSPSPAPPPTSPDTFTDLADAPPELRSYIDDLAQLGVLDAATGEQFAPNEPITRRDYARWLLTTNNRLFSDRSSNVIRLGGATEQPAFQDVPSTDPDFEIIQGLADAGLIPSPLSGDATVVNFRPDAPLTREDLIRWKVPLDVRRALPNATVDAVKETWGFQDAAQIDPAALQAVLADYQNGDRANIRRAFGFTTLFQPNKTVTRAEAAAVLWYFGYQGDGVSAQDTL